MRLLLDQDVYAVTVIFLIDAGHDVLAVAEIGLSQASAFVVVEADGHRFRKPAK
jgi:hypothetical protein